MRQPSPRYLTSSSVKRNLLNAKIAGLTTDQILQAVVVIGSGQVEMEQRLVRALLIDEFIRREGVDAGDMLMDRVGL